MADQRHIGVLEGMLPEALRGKPRADAKATASTRPLFSKPTRFAISCMLVLGGFMFYAMSRSEINTMAAVFFGSSLTSFFLGFRGLGTLIFIEPGQVASTNAAQSNRSRSNQAEGS